MLSKAQSKLVATIETLTKKNETTPLTSHELVRLINAKLNVENKTLSGVYKNLFVNPSSDVMDLVKLMCGGVVPTFETFKTAMLEKDATKVYFSNYSGLLSAARLSKSALAADKVAKQGGTIIKAAKAPKVSTIEDVAKAAKAPKVSTIEDVWSQYKRV